MNLRIRTLGIIIIALLGVSATVYFASSAIILDRFRNVEQDQASEDLGRARETIGGEAARLQSISTDWAAWDETYAFALGQDPDYVEVNLGDDTLAYLHVDMMLYFDSDGGLAYGKAIDQAEGTEVPPAEGVVSAIAATAHLVAPSGTTDATSGIVSTPDGPVIAASYPIVTSAGEGPIAGSLVVVRWVEGDFLASLQSTTRLTVSTYDAGAPPGQVPSLAPEAELIEEVNSHNLVAYTAVGDVDGAPALGLSIDIRRDIYAEGRQLVNYLLIVLFGIGLVFSAVMISLLETSVIRPVRRLSSFVSSVGGRASMRAPDLGPDEIGQLGRSVNQMLDSLEHSSRELETANIQLTAERKLVEELNQTLEAKVAERTSDLIAANDELRERNRQLMEARIQAATDSLTGLGNHRSFHDALRAAVGDATRRAPLAVFMIDIDNFKLINDQLGHQAGDRILAEVGNTIREAIAGAGAVFRYGGDEFAALAGVASLPEARLLGERLRNDVLARFQESGVSISIGIALHNDALLSAEEVTYRADSAMYSAKSAGKNCVHVWTPLEAAQLTR